MFAQASALRAQAGGKLIKFLSSRASPSASSPHLPRMLVSPSWQSPLGPSSTVCWPRPLPAPDSPEPAQILLTSGGGWAAEEAGAQPPPALPPSSGGLAPPARAAMMKRGRGGSSGSPGPGRSDGMTDATAFLSHTRATAGAGLQPKSINSVAE